MHETLNRNEKMLLANPEGTQLLVASCIPGTNLRRAPKIVRRRWAETAWVYGTLRQTKSLRREIGRPYWNSLEEFHLALDQYVEAGWKVVTVRQLDV